MTALLAWTFAILIGLTVAFQWCLVLGAPWGHLTMGGKIAGRLPAALRIAAGVQSLLLLVLAALVLSRAEVAFKSLEPYAYNGAWGAVAISVVAAVLNLITPSRQERALWAPVTLLMLVCATSVAWP